MAEQAEEDVFYAKNEASVSYVYPHMPMTTLGAKLSISDIKKMKAYDGKGYDINTEFALPDTAEQEIEKNLPKRAQSAGKTGTLTGAERGTIVHKFMEMLPFEAVDTDGDLDAYIAQQKAALLARGIFDVAIYAWMPYDRSCALGQSVQGTAVFCGYSGIGGV